jgi:hypothetical protein
VEAKPILLHAQLTARFAQTAATVAVLPRFSCAAFL